MSIFRSETCQGRRPSAQLPINTLTDLCGYATYWAPRLRIGPRERKIDSIEAVSAKPLFVNGWEVAGITGAEKFFLALPEILPLPANLCFEGTRTSLDALVLFGSNATAQTLEIPHGTIWPKPTMFHVHATRQFLLQLAECAGRHAEAEICDHFHAYSNSQGLMQWYDAFSGEPLLIEASIPEANVQDFCRKLGAKYAPWHAPLGRE